MRLNSLRNRARPDNLHNQVRGAQSLARRLYLGGLLAGAVWIVFALFGPMLLMDADGLVVRDRDVLAPAFSAQVIRVDVRPGDRVPAGATLGATVSTQMMDLISDLTTQKMRASARRDQIRARREAIEATQSAADQRAEQALAVFRTVERAKSAGFSTNARYADASQARYESAREAASLRAEKIALESEAVALESQISRLQTALDTATRSYDDGRIVAPTDGTVGPKVVAPGTVLKPGEGFAELYRGKSYVVAYLPTNRLYSVTAGERVMVSDGINRQPGTVERIEGITDAVPPEFQSNFRSIERQQVIRVRLDGDIGLPLYSKIKVVSRFSPGNLFAWARNSL